MKKIVFFTVLVGLAFGFTGCESKEEKVKRCVQDWYATLMVSGEQAALKSLSKECLEVLLEIENEERIKNGFEPKDMDTFLGKSKKNSQSTPDDEASQNKNTDAPTKSPRWY
jgi:hypothetical protein